MCVIDAIKRWSFSFPIENLCGLQCLKHTYHDLTFGNSQTLIIIMITYSNFTGTDTLMHSESDPPPQILITATVFNLLVWIMASCFVTLLLIIDLVLCMTYSKGVTHFIFVQRCGLVRPAPTDDLEAKPAKESAVWRSRAGSYSRFTRKFNLWSISSLCVSYVKRSKLEEKISNMMQIAFASNNTTEDTKVSINWKQYQNYRRP